MKDSVIQIGSVVDDTNIGFKNPQRGRVYDKHGIAYRDSYLSGA